MGRAPLLMGLWLAMVAAGFWWFEYRHWQRFASHSVVFDAQVLQSLLPTLPNQQGIRVAHFVDESCPCTRYSKRHIQDLQPSLQHTVQHVVRPLDALPINIPASPAVAVWDEQGQLAYFGPYSSGTVCGLGRDFVSRVMDKLNTRDNPQWINMVAVGCYCPWRSSKNVNLDGLVKGGESS